MSQQQSDLLAVEPEDIRRQPFLVRSLPEDPLIP